MATLDSGDSNILDAEAINWRLVVYPLLLVVVIVIGGFGYYFNQLNEREQREIQARAALLKATTPEQLVQVADQFPKTDQALMALIDAGNQSFAKKDYEGAIKIYQRAINAPEADEVLAEVARLGLASTLEASGKIDDAISTYLIEAHLGNKSPYAPYAYHSVAAIYAQRNDKENERKILTEMLALGSDSPFVKQAEPQLKKLNEELVKPAAPTPAPAATINAPVAPTTPPPAAAPSTPPKS